MFMNICIHTILRVSLKSGGRKELMSRVRMVLDIALHLTNYINNK